MSHNFTTVFVLFTVLWALSQQVTGTSSSSEGLASTCFPYGTATLKKDLSKPNVSLKEWWCPHSLQYGFQGFSYPLMEDCNAFSNTYEHINNDFAAMKRDFGATMVRVYYPLCTEPSVFENLIRAGVNNNMAVIPQVWFDFDGGTETGRRSSEALYAVMNSTTYGPVAPYVFHSADFGSEPIGDGVDGGTEHFIADLKSFKAKMNSYGVPVGISEDWDRPGIMSNADGTGLGDIGHQIKQSSDYAHAHIMPFYHNNLTEAESWRYIASQLEFLKSTVQLPGVLITETQWAWGPNEHSPSRNDVGVSQYTAYWKKYDSECETLKKMGIGWFIHTWANDGTFDMNKDDGGSYVIPEWRPRRC